MKKDNSKISIENKKKSIFMSKFRYDLYVASKLISNPNNEKDIDV